MNINELFDDILNRKVSNTTGGIRGICKRCGNIQTHNLIWCKNCGDKFFVPKTKMTVFEMMKIVRNSTGKDIQPYRPYYQAAIFRMELREHGYTETDFITYVENKLEHEII